MRAVPGAVPRPFRDVTREEFALRVVHDQVKARAAKKLRAEWVRPARLRPSNARKESGGTAGRGPSRPSRRNRVKDGNLHSAAAQSK
jgi:hypothetical protein